MAIPLIMREIMMGKKYRASMFRSLVILTLLWVHLCTPRSAIGGTALHTGDGKSKGLNILLISIDTLRADHLGIYGYDKIETPCIDELGSNGIVFSHAYAQCPVTLPSHTSILSGTYPVYHGVRNNGNFIVPETLTTVAEILKGKGYFTAAVVGAFVLDSRFGLDQGFDLYLDNMAEDKGSRLIGFSEISAKAVTEKAGDIIRQKRGNGKPFFLFVHYFDPHALYQPPYPYSSKYADHPYDGEIAFVDEQIGLLIETLKKAKVFDRTLVVITSDHGEGLMEHDEMTHGIFVYDTTLHIPLIFSHPLLCKGPRVIEDIVETVDIVPTVLDLAGVDVPKETGIQGKSLLPLIKGATGVDEPFVYFETLLPFYEHGWCSLRGVRKGDYKFIDAPDPELYHVKADPREEKNIIEKERDRADALKRVLMRFVDDNSSTAHMQKSRQPIDAEIRQKLASLGYIAGSQVHGTMENPFQGPDPKGKISINLSYHRAVTNFEKGEYQKAVQLMEELIDKDPRNRQTYISLASMHERRRQLDRAVDVYLKGLTHYPDDVDFHVQLGKVYLWKNSLVEGIEELQKALAIEKDHIPAHNHLGIAYAKTGDLDKAVVEMKKIIELDPENLKAYNNLGLAYHKKGMTKKAIECFEQALAINQDFLQAYENLGRVYQDNGMIDKAIETLETVLTIDPARGDIHNLLGTLHMKKDRISIAEEHFEEARHLGYPVDQSLIRTTRDAANSRQ
jgi:arylsulfatase A-like enzyme/Tfp pilus assembly protein PilF